MSTIFRYFDLLALYNVQYVNDFVGCPDITFLANWQEKLNYLNQNQFQKLNSLLNASTKYRQKKLIIKP